MQQNQKNKLVQDYKNKKTTKSRKIIKQRNYNNPFKLKSTQKKVLYSFCFYFCFCIKSMYVSQAPKQQSTLVNINTYIYIYLSQIQQCLEFLATAAATTPFVSNARLIDSECDRSLSVKNYLQTYEIVLYMCIHFNYISLSVRCPVYYCKKPHERKREYPPIFFAMLYIMFQKSACHSASSPSPHFSWTNLIFSTDLHIPLQLQSKEATHTLPACAFHSQSV